MKIDFQDITLIVVEKNCGIIRMNSAILTNLFYTKGVQLDITCLIILLWKTYLDLTQKLKELVYSKDLQNKKESIYTPVDPWFTQTGQLGCLFIFLGFC
jgi:hypothetical protein